MRQDEPGDRKEARRGQRGREGWEIGRETGRETQRDREICTQRDRVEREGGGKRWGGERDKERE